MNNYKKRLIMLFVIVILILIFSGIISYYCIELKIDNAWISLMFSLVGSLSGGIFTMIGVLITLNRGEEITKVNEIKEKQQIARILYIETRMFLETMEKFLVSRKQGKLLQLKLLYEGAYHTNLKETENMYMFEEIYLISDLFKENIAKFNFFIDIEDSWIINKLLDLDNLNRKIIHNPKSKKDIPLGLGIEKITEIYTKQFTQFFFDVEYGEVECSKIIQNKNISNERYKKAKNFIEENFTISIKLQTEIGNNNFHFNEEYKKILSILEYMAK